VVLHYVPRGTLINESTAKTFLGEGNSWT